MEEIYEKLTMKEESLNDILPVSNPNINYINESD